jgi:hypothetical protein
MDTKQLERAIADLRQQVAANDQAITAAQALPFYGSRKGSKLDGLYQLSTDLSLRLSRLQEQLPAEHPDYLAPLFTAPRQRPRRSGPWRGRGLRFAG